MESEVMMLHKGETFMFYSEFLIYLTISLL